jgi:phospholipid/cholesterol/gamma-HCH transport system substrate-binding protein
MVTQAPRRIAVLTIVAFIAVCIGLVIYVWTQFGGSLPLNPAGYRFTASFAQASQLTPNADVRMAGVNVGKVVSVRRQGLHALVTIRLDHPYAPLASDSHAILRQKTLLGETFVALTPGSAHAPKLPDGGHLADANIERTQQLDTVLGSFDAPTQRNLQRLLRGLSGALDQRGSDLNDALGNADPALATLADVTAIVDRQRQPFGRLVRDTGTVLQTIGDRRADLDRLVGAGNQVLGATAARNRELTSTVRALPPFLSQLRATLHAVDRTAGYTGPTLKALRPVAPLVRPALAELITLSPEIQGLMRDIGPVITASTSGLPAVTRIVEATGPFVDQVLATARQVIPQIDLTKVYATPLAASFANIAAAYEATVPLGDGSRVHYLRNIIINTSETPLATREHRLGTSRHNPYPAPDILNGVGHGGIAASDCRNTSNPGFGDAPPCHLQPPLSFAGKLSYFPQLVPLPRPRR